MSKIEETIKVDEIELSEEKPGKRKQAESGVIGNILDTVVTIQNTVLDYRNVTFDQLVFMTKNDGQAKGILNAVKYPVRMARPNIKAVDGGEAEAEFVDKNLLKSPGEGGMETPINVITSRMALAVRDGYKIFEKVWEQKEGKLWLKKLAYRSNETTKFTYDKNGSVSGAHQNGSFKDRYVDVYWKKDKIAYYIYNEEENPYVGESDFYPVFYHYDKKHKLYAVAHLAYQLNAVPIRLGSHPKNIAPKDLEAFRDALKALGTHVAMTFPEECEVTPFESKRSLHEFLGLIQHHDSMMSRAFLTQFMNLGQEGRGGSYALSSDQSNLFLMSIMSLLDGIAQVFNTQVIPQLIDYNFGTKKYPTLEFTPFSDTIRSAITSTFYALLAARFPSISPEFALAMEESVSDELGLDLDYKAIRERIEKERAALEQAESNAVPVDNESVKGKAPGAKDETEKELMKE
jgi:hypothetical protein